MTHPESDSMAEFRPVLMQLRQRVESRISAGLPPPGAVALPDDKAQFPKMLCLDTNQWIYLAKAHYGRNDGTQYGAPLEAVRRAIANRQLVVPITTINFVETAETQDPGRRRRLAEFMVELSGNQSMVFGDAVLKAELHRAVLTLFMRQMAPVFPRCKLLHFGLHAAAGQRPVVLDDSVGEMVTQAMYEPEMSVLLLTEAISPDVVCESRRLDHEGARMAFEVRQIDVGLDPAEKRYREFMNVLVDSHVASILRSVLNELSVNESEFFTWLADRDNVMRFGDAIPALDVELALIMKRDRNKDADNKANDGKDFGFLCQAIPYANIVVTEKLWTDVARSAKLDQRYQTAVLARLRDLPRALERCGCI